MIRSMETTRPTRRVGALATGILLSLGLFATPAGAEDSATPPSPDDNIQITKEDMAFEYITDGTAGEVRELASYAVSGDNADKVGKKCDVRVISENETNPSVHPGNTLVVATGGATQEIADVEAAPGSGKTDIIKGITLGDTIVLSIKLGEEGKSSLGFYVDFECTPEDLIIVNPGNQVPPPAAPAQPVPAQPTYTG